MAYSSVEHCTPSELYLVGVEQDYNVSSFHDCLKSLISMSSCPDLLTEEVFSFKRPTAVPFLIADCSKFSSATGWIPKLSRDILVDTLDYWRKNHSSYMYPNLINNVYPS